MPSPKSQWLNCIIRGLPTDATRDDVAQHIESLTPCVPTVSAIVRDRHTQSSSATVSIRLGSSSADDVVAVLDGTQFNGLRKNRIVVDKTFRGLNTLVDAPDSRVDFCFVHGLGGHAFNSWTGYSPQESDPPFMWARDFLPLRFRSEGISARIMSYGHDANVIVRSNPQATISTAAAQLLSEFMADRARHPDRPIYFVCHSLGGLIVCQALIDSLCTDPGFTVKPDYQRMFMHNGSCMVKGIVFFGTPFRGSGQANFVYPFLKLLASQAFWPVNTELVKSLKNRDIALGQIVGRFNRIRKAQNIQLLPCYETKAVVGTSLTTDRSSAIHAFDRDVAPLEIAGDHHQIIKFPHEHDDGYRSVENRIVYMVKTIPSLATQPFASQQRPTVSGTQSDNTRPGQASFSSSPPPPRVGPSNSFPVMPSSSFGAMQPSRTVTAHAGTGMVTSGSFGRPPTPPGVVPAMNRLSIASIRPNLSEADFEALIDFDTVFIIDDTGSMQKPIISSAPAATSVPDRWSALLAALEAFAPIAAAHDTDGIDIQFLKNRHLNPAGRAIRDVRAARDLLGRINLADPISGGGTLFCEQLRAAIEPRMQAFRDYARRKTERRSSRYLQVPKPLNLIVVTDGEADDEVEVERYIVQVARELGALGAPKTYVGIQFVQIGDDVEAAEYLRRLDDDLRNTASGERIRDIVDTTPFRGHWIDGQIEADANQNFAKILMGAIVKKLDKLSNQMTPPQSEDDDDDSD